MAPRQLKRYTVYVLPISDLSTSDCVKRREQERNCAFPSNTQQHKENYNSGVLYTVKSPKI